MDMEATVQETPRMVRKLLDRANFLLDDKDDHDKRDRRDIF